MEKKILKPYHGIIFFILAVVVLIFPGSFMQTFWGVPGLVATEIMYLALSVIYVLILKGDLKKVFPFKKVKLISVIGTFFLWVGILLVVMILTMILAALFPEQMASTSDGLSTFFSQMPLFVQIIVVALLPAFCEEMVHRGVILNSFMTIRNKWLVIIGVGVLFGINHLSIWRFVPTAVLGIALTYVVYETGNIFYSMLFHFLNNAFSTLASTSVSSSEMAELSEYSLSMYNDTGVMLMSIGVYMIFSCFAPFLIYTSAYLIRFGKNDDEEVKYFPEGYKGWVLGILIGLTAFLLLGGGILLIGGMIITSYSI